MAVLYFVHVQTDTLKIHFYLVKLMFQKEREREIKIKVKILEELKLK